MHKNKINNRTKYYVKVKSTVHPDIYHTVLVDLHCYEQMPKGEKRQNRSKKNSRKNL